MKMKYIILVTVVLNVICLCIFVHRQYKAYHSRKSDYLHAIETINARIIDEIENTAFYSDTDPRIDRSAKNILVFHFSMEACQPCLEGISETIESEFPDYAKNKQIVFYSNDIENRLRKNFLGKQITTSLKEEKLPLSKQITPLLFTIDSNHLIQNIFIPDKDNRASLKNYLKKIKMMVSANNHYSD